MFFVMSSESVPCCPRCGSTLRYRDSRLRIRKKEGGITEHLMIRRFYCENCHSYHNELPDCLVPYKHYETEVISGVIEEIVTPDDTDSEEYPSVQTMLRWLYWFQKNITNIEGHLRNAGVRILGLGRDFLFSPDSLLAQLQQTHQNWLEIILRIIYNSGSFLPACSF